MKLLPHKIQKPAGIFFLVCLALLSVMLSFTFFDVIEGGDSSFTAVLTWLNSNAVILLRIFVIAFYLSFAALLFSEERVEDEMISHLRLRAVAISAFIVIVLKLVEQIIWVLLPLDFMDSFRDVRNDFKGGGVSALIILYLLIFKRSLHKYTGASDEE